MSVPWSALYPDSLPRTAEEFARDPYEAHVLATDPIRTGERVLEVGCSTGYITEFLIRERGCSVVAIETNAAAASVTRQRTGATVIVPEGQDADLGARYERSFDVILCSDVVEHVMDPERFMDNLLRYLRPGGRVILSIPNVAHWTIRVQLLRGRFNYEPQGIMAADHVRFFTRDSLYRFLREMGLVPLSVRYSVGRWTYTRRWMRPLAARPALIARLANRWPTLFALQFVVEAELSASHHGRRRARREADDPSAALVQCGVELVTRERGTLTTVTAA